MKVILKQTITKLGQEGDVVNVKPGFGRNYLIPQGMATLATPGALRSLENERDAIQRRAQQAVNSAADLARRIEKADVTIPVLVGEENRIFGSITNRQIAEILAEQGIEIDRRNITITDEIKSPGTYEAVVDLLGDIKATVNVHVVVRDQGTED
jgi:large subunit ribosomal protein L9